LSVVVGGSFAWGWLMVGLGELAWVAVVVVFSGWVSFCEGVKEVIVWWLRGPRCCVCLCGGCLCWLRVGLVLRDVVVSGFVGVVVWCGAWWGLLSCLLGLWFGYGGGLLSGRRMLGAWGGRFCRKGLVVDFGGVGGRLGW